MYADLGYWIISGPALRCRVSRTMLQADRTETRPEFWSTAVFWYNSRTHHRRRISSNPGITAPRGVKYLYSGRHCPSKKGALIECYLVSGAISRQNRTHWLQFLYTGSQQSQYRYGCFVGANHPAEEGGAQLRNAASLEPFSIWFKELSYTSIRRFPLICWEMAPETGQNSLNHLEWGSTEMVASAVPTTRRERGCLSAPKSLRTPSSLPCHWSHLPADYEGRAPIPVHLHPEGQMPVWWLRRCRPRGRRGGAQLRDAASLEPFSI